MERNWARRGEWLEVPPDRVEVCVRRAFPDAAVTAIEPLGGGLRNTNLRVSLAGASRPFVYRAYGADPDACCREAAVLVSVPDGVPVPALHFADSSDEPPWALLDCVEGVPADEALATASPAAALAFAQECGAALARIHTLAFPRCGFLGPALSVVSPMAPWSEILPLVAAPCRPLFGEGLRRRIEGVVRRCAPEVDPLFSTPVLCHGDYKLWNLLARAEDGQDGERGDDDEPPAPRLAAVLDWEFAFAGPGLFDAGVFLRDEARRPAGYAEAFERGYGQAGGLLPDGWRRLAGLLDLVNLCQLLAHGDPATAADLLPLVEATLDRAETSAEPR